MNAPQNSPRHDAPALRARYDTIRDEVRVKLHLLGMDAKDAFAKIEKEADQLGRELDHSAHEALGALVARLEKLLQH